MLMSTRTCSSGSGRLRTSIAFVDADSSWPAQFDELADRIRLALGDRVLELEHIGSTSTPHAQSYAPNYSNQSGLIEIEAIAARA